MKTKPLGTVHPVNTAWLHVHAGEAKIGRRKYDLSYTLAGSPIVRSAKTNKPFTLSWSEIVDLAIAAGIDKP